MSTQSIWGETIHPKVVNMFCGRAEPDETLSEARIISEYGGTVKIYTEQYGDWPSVKNSVKIITGLFPYFPGGFVWDKLSFFFPDCIADSEVATSLAEDAYHHDTYDEPINLEVYQVHKIGTDWFTSPWSEGTHLFEMYPSTELAEYRPYDPSTDQWGIFSDYSCPVPLNDIFGEPLDVTIELSANTLWYATGIILQAGDFFYISVDPADEWWITPGSGWCGASGAGFLASGGYALPGYLEGCLIAKIGSSAFYVGPGGELTTQEDGELLLAANDDLSSYGPGYSDNRGSITVHIGLI